MLNGVRTMMAPSLLLLVTSIHWLVAAYDNKNEDYELVWEDTFNKWDEEKWTIEVDAFRGGNFEFQANTPSSENSYIRDNTLYIRPTLLNSTINPETKQAFGNHFHEDGVLNLNELYGKCNQHCIKRDKAIPPVLSAHLASKCSFRYGRVEIVARMSAGDWIAPVIGLLPSEYVYGNWPRSGSVTIAQSRGNRQEVDRSTAGVQQTDLLMFWGPDYTDFRFQETMKTNKNLSYNFADHYHKYTLDWSEEGMAFLLDEKEVWTLRRPPNGFWERGRPWSWKGRNPWEKGTPMAPFDQKFQVHFWVSVGGNSGYFPDNARKPWKNNDGYSNVKFWEARDQWLPSWNGEETALQIRSLKIYQRKVTHSTDTDEGVPAVPRGDPRIIGAVAAAAVISLAILAGIIYCCFKQPSVVEERSYHPDGENYATRPPKSPSTIAYVTVAPPLGVLRPQSVDSNHFYESVEPHQYITVY